MVVIACHNSAAGIQNTLRSLLQIFPARNIFIADNNGALTPTDDTEAKVSPHNWESIHHFRGCVSLQG
jgi:hypothetical protein